MDYRVLLKKYICHVVNQNIARTGDSMRLPVELTPDESTALVEIQYEIAEEIASTPLKDRLQWLEGKTRR